MSNGRRPREGLPLDLLGKLRWVDRLLFDVAEAARDAELRNAVRRHRAELRAETTAAIERGKEIQNG